MIVKNKDNEFGKILQKIRLNAGYKQSEVAEEIKIPRCKLSNYERGAQVPSTYNFIKLYNLYRQHTNIDYKSLKTAYNNRLKIAVHVRMN